jgi:gamma-glutamylcyclotransferase (GGCT)/AIG2-like uncharacterized protein YtfP
VVAERYLFVYGSLKRGGRLSGILKRCTYVGNGALEGYDMYCVPNCWYPGIQKGTKGCGFVHGEVFKIPEAMLARLDNAENVPFLYVRNTHKILMGDITLDCEVYIYNRPLADIKAMLIVNGDWDVRQ